MFLENIKFLSPEERSLVLLKSVIDNKSHL
jgi:hypothetical protein